MKVRDNPNHKWLRPPSYFLHGSGQTILLPGFDYDSFAAPAMFEGIRFGGWFKRGSQSKALQSFVGRFLFFGFLMIFMLLHTAGCGLNQVTLSGWFGLVVWRFEPLVFVEGK